MNRESVFQYQRAPQVGVVPPRARPRCQPWAAIDDALGGGLEVGQVEHWDSIEHIEYGSFVDEFDMDGGNAYGPGSGYDWTGAQR